MYDYLFVLLETFVQMEIENDDFYQYFYPRKVLMACLFAVKSEINYPYSLLYMMMMHITINSFACIHFIYSQHYMRHIDGVLSKFEIII